MAAESESEYNDSPIEQVRVSIPITDDKTQLTLTFRTWVLGTLGCAFQACLVAFSRYRQNPITIPSICTQIAILGIGKLVAAILPAKSVKVPGTNWIISMNPGPFSVKEHALIYTFASQGYQSPFMISMVTTIKAYYHRSVPFVSTLLMALSSNMMGYGLAGFMKGFLVDSPHMWWPSTVSDVVLFQTLHEKKESRAKGHISKKHMFIIVSICSFSYYIVPGYLFPSITTLSFICWFWNNSVTAQQIGAARNGLGLGSFAFDWTVCYLDPLYTPLFSLNNKMLGFVLFFYVIIPIAYWNNIYDAKRFPIFSSSIFDYNGHKFNVSRVLDPKTFKFSDKELQTYSSMHLSVFYAFAYGFYFASITSSITYVSIYHGRTIWQLLKGASFEQNEGDVHNRLMRKYDRIPLWWFCALLIISMCTGIFITTFGESMFRLPIWLVPFACGLGFLLALVCAIFLATTNQEPPFTVVPELMMGYIFPGRPITNLLFKNFTTESMWSAIYLLGDLKFGHYMKIPPKSMLIVTGLAISYVADFGFSWYLLSSVPNICNPKMLPKGSPWTCPGLEVFTDVASIWGIIGPANLFAPNGIYANMYLFFLVGAVTTLTIWILSRIYPDKKWINLICVPLIFSSVTGMPPGRPVELWTTWVIALLYYVVVYGKFRWWWDKYTFVLSNGLSTGAALMGVLIYLALQMNDIYGVDWWGLSYDDHCPLAHCPTAPGVVVEGCPIF